MIPITVHVRASRVEEFYVRFAEFIVEAPDVAAPLILPSGTVPTWIETDDAPALASRLMSELSPMGYFVLRHLIDGARKQTVHLSPDELASLTQHPHGKSGVAGILGGVGKSIRRAGLPMYRTPNGRDTWHYVWGWDGVRYSMTPEVAKLLKAARPR
ncbi:DUF6416 domain-containing protein [Microbacterium sp. VKM Ac-2923]|uniref:DUF6416 domain-containing protein n=1 Tax=Microbacterium sp. VKM Ac-2923 TaxID=2929476 RepID=UPI001FB21044|nr:DUF6416 domain-containing protein [Microbacterium sp. VKM Ac-2923]MCJ1708545.1 DUF6416 domain-containing protein [Microbacterium sp. VKM Ac-2923]